MSIEHDIEEFNELYSKFLDTWFRINNALVVNGVSRFIIEEVNLAMSDLDLDLSKKAMSPELKKRVNRYYRAIGSIIKREQRRL